MADKRVKMTVIRGELGNPVAVTINGGGEIPVVYATPVLGDEGTNYSITIANPDVVVERREAPKAKE